MRKAWPTARRWLTYRAPWWESSDRCDERLSIDLVVLRSIGIGYFAFMVLGTAATRPHPSAHGRGAAVLVALCVLCVGFVVANPRSRLEPRRRVVALGAVAVAGAVIAYVQPTGLWEAVPIYVAIVAAMRLERAVAFWVMGLTFVVLGIAAGLGGHWSNFLWATVATVPWFVVISQMRRLHEQTVALEASRAAEASAATAAERGRLAREMHDVLAHSLSALALQLESTRLLAHDRGVDEDVARAIDQAHGLAASGLEEARRAIAAARGDALPGPERLRDLADAAAEQSGLPITFDVSGEPRELPADARLAVYRTAQEALTNIRRHATPDRVEMRLSYEDQAVVLEVADHGSAAVPAFAGNGAGHASLGAGYGLTGMRERAELLGGTLVAEPTDDGFRVRLWLPA